MPARARLEALFLDNLPTTERIAGAICRRHAVPADDTADFVSWARLKLVEHDYAILAKFRGESALATYLTVVIAMLFRDYRVHRWGRWRPSAAALHRGNVAVQLEILIYRDGHRFDQAAEILRTRGDTALPDRELAALFARLPARAPVRPREVGIDALTEMATDRGANSQADDEAMDRHWIDERLLSAMTQLAAEDQVLLRMRYWDAMSIADIARALRVPQKPLYRRIERALAELRRHVEAAGLSHEDARAMLAGWET